MTTAQTILLGLIVLAVVVVVAMFFLQRAAVRRGYVDKNEDALDAEERFQAISDSTRAALMDESGPAPYPRRRVRAGTNTQPTN